MWYKVNWIYVWADKVRPPVPPIPYLCFTANTAGSTVELNKVGSPTNVSLQVSTNWNNWSNYIPWSWTTIQLQNIWDKIYFRNTSETTTWFSINGANYYKFVMTWSIAASWDVTWLLNKNFTDTVSDNCFNSLFNGCGSLTSAPELPATTLRDNCYVQMFQLCNNLLKAPDLPAKTMKTSCYHYMFNGCTSITEPPKIWAETLGNYCFYGMFNNCSNLEKLPKLPILTVPAYAYAYMFYGCSKIKLSTTQTWEYQTPYRIPETWTWSAGNRALDYMFYGTWWTFTWKPSINTTYYTSNTIV